MDDALKQAVLRILPAVPQPALEAAPDPLYDLGVANVCPLCSGMDGLLQEKDGVKLVHCPDCFTEFSLRTEAISRTVIRRISERRLRRRQSLAHAIKSQDRLKSEMFRLLGV